MGLFSDNIGLLAASSSGAGVDLGHPIENSCRFNDDDSANLTATLGTATDTDVYTISLWVKRGNLGLLNYIFSAGPVSTTTEDFIGFQSNDTIFVRWAGTTRLATTQVFRDPSAWYHVILACDYGASGSDKAKLYINGEEVTSFGTDTRSSITGANQRWNTATLHYFGRNAPAGGQYLDGYLAEVVFIDGQALDPTSFGEFNSIGMWVPKDVSGLTYGTNGFHLDFADSGDIGNDVSGNSNDFTPSGLAANDIMPDTPTNNFCTWSPLASRTVNKPRNGNLEYLASSTTPRTNHATFGALSGKWYFEWSLASLPVSVFTGVITNTDEVQRTYWPGGSGGSGNALKAVGFGPYNSSILVACIATGIENASTTWTATVSTMTTSTVFQCAFDCDTGKVWFGIDGTWFDGSGGTTGNPSTGANPSITLTAAETTLMIPATGASVTAYVFANFGQMPSGAGGNADGNGYGNFDYAVPTGFLTLCTANLGTPTIKDPSAHFDIVLYTGNGTAIGSGGNEISNLSFQPDLVWIKNRDAADYHVFADSVTGAGKYQAIDTSIEFLTTDAESIASFDADGFTVGNNVAVNTNTEDYVAWCWKKGATSGVDVVNYTGDGNNNRAISHSLGVTPEFAFFMYREAATYDAYKFVVMPTILGTGATNYLDFGSSGAENSLGSAGDWLGTVPDWNSSTFSVGTYAGVNESGIDMTTVLFASVEGFSKIGSYTGNGSADGPFVWCGFRPEFVICKVRSTTGNWYIFDSKREGYNVDNDELVADDTTAESTTDRIDLLSNGFKLRTTTGPNASGTYIFIAFAEAPFAYARAR